MEEEQSQKLQQNELIGGFKNAIEKKENIQSIAQSFLNAGYKKEKIDNAMKEISQKTNSQEQKPTPIEQPKKKTSNIKLIIIISILLVAGAVAIMLFMQ